MARLRSGRPVVAGWMSTPSLLVAQTLAAAGADAVVVDMQHGSASMSDLPGLIAGIELRGAEPFVRVPTLDAGLIGWLLDAGATGLIAPLVETAAQARALVHAVRYPPAGGRSYGPRVPMLRYGARYGQVANDEVVTLAMIETTAGIAALDDIAGTEGLTGIFIGPSDLSLSLGHLPIADKLPADVADTIGAIRARSAALGARTGIFCPSVEAGETAISAGFDLVTLPPELALVQAGARAGVERLRRP